MSHVWKRPPGLDNPPPQPEPVGVKSMPMPPKPKPKPRRTYTKSSRKPAEPVMPDVTEEQLAEIMKEPHWWLKGIGRQITGSNNRRLFETPEQLWAAFLEYVKDVAENPLYEEKVFSGPDSDTVKRAKVAKMRPLTTKGFSLHAGFTVAAFDYWYKSRDDLRDTVQAIRDACYTHKYEGAAAGLFNANLVIRDLGLADAHNINAGIDGTPTITAEVIDTSNVANLYHPDDLECVGPMYTQEQLEAGMPWTPPGDQIAAQ